MVRRPIVDGVTYASNKRFKRGDDLANAAGLRKCHSGMTVERLCKNEPLYGPHAMVSISMIAMVLIGLIVIIRTVGLLSAYDRAARGLGT